jgi:hypothetical protein
VKEFVWTISIVLAVLGLLVLSFFGPYKIRVPQTHSTRIALIPLDRDTTFVGLDATRVDRIVLRSSSEENYSLRTLRFLFPVRHTDDPDRIKKFCRLARMRVEHSDIATITSDIFAYHKDTIVYWGAISIDDRNAELSFQDREYGCTTVSLTSEIRDLLSDFDVFWWPVIFVPVAN